MIMFIDVCIPSGNEEEFVSMAEKLGTKAIMFLYKGKSPVIESKKVKIFYGKLGEGGVFSFTIGERKFVESKNSRFHYGFQELEQKDSLHYRKSGINQVIGKLMKDKEKVLVIDVESFIVSKNVVKSLGRLKFNLEMAKKYDLNLVICSFASNPWNMRSSKDYESLIRSLGYQKEAKKATTMLAYILKENSNL